MPKTVTKKKLPRRRQILKLKRKRGKIKKFQRKKRRLHTFPSALKKNKK